MFVWGRGTLAKVKGGAKRRIKVKRESLPTGTSGVAIPSRHNHTFFTYLYRLRQGGSYTKWPLMSYLNKRILFCCLNVDCFLPVDLTLYKFGSDFPKYLVLFYFIFLIEVLRLNDNRFVRHTSKFAKLQFARCSELSDVSFVKGIYMA